MRRCIVVTTASLTIAGILFTGCNDTANREDTSGANATASASTPVEGHPFNGEARLP